MHGLLGQPRSRGWQKLCKILYAHHNWKTFTSTYKTNQAMELNKNVLEDNHVHELRTVQLQREESDQKEE